MMNYKLLILLIIFCPCIYSSDCQPNIIDELKCYDNRITGMDNCIFNKSDMSFLFNKLTDEFEVKVSLKLECKLTEYEIKLSVYETDSTVTDCSNIKYYDETYYKKHSIITYKRQNSNDSSIRKCEEQTKITFSNIYSGCYAIRFEPKYTVFTLTPVTIIGIQIDTNYNKTVIGQLNITTDYRNDDSTLQLIITNITHNNWCFSFSRVNISWIANCSPISGNIERTICNISGNPEDVECYMTKVNPKENSSKTIECNIRGIFKGDNIFKIAIITSDIRCLADSVWGETPCEWNINITIPSSDLTTTESSLENEETNSQYLYIVLIIGIVLLMGGLFVYKTRRSERGRLLSIENNDAECKLIETPKVLLLYARENELFFKTMTTFKNLMETYSNSQVYDIYDPLNFDQIAIDPDHSICEKLQDDAFKIVLILNETGYLLSNSNTSSTSVYKQKQCYDNLFPYAIKILSQNLKNNESYTKLFIVRFNFDRNEYRYFEFLNPFTRYKLPDNFDQLLLNMFDIQINNSELEQSSEYKIFIEDYNKLKRFHMETSDYIKDILNVETVKNVPNKVIQKAVI